MFGAVTAFLTGIALGNLPAIGGGVSCYFLVVLTILVDWEGLWSLVFMALCMFDSDEATVSIDTSLIASVMF